MIKKMFSIRDSKAGAFISQFLKNTHGEAERDFATIAKDEKSTIYQYPDDFDLYYLGDFDDNTGKFFIPDTPQHMLKAVNVLTR